MIVASKEIVNLSVLISAEKEIESKGGSDYHQMIQLNF